MKALAKAILACVFGLTALAVPPPFLTTPRSITTWSALSDQDVRSYWQTLIVLEDGGIAVATPTADLPAWANLSVPMPKLAVADASLSGKWVRAFGNGPVNPRWCGAVGDGSTDDTAAMDAAIAIANAIGSWVLLDPEMTYALDTSSVKHIRIDIRGAGETSVLKNVEDGSSNEEYLWIADALTDVRLENVSIENGYTVFRVIDGLDQNIKHLDLENTFWVNSRNGIISSAVMFTNTWIESVSAHGLRATADTDVYSKAGAALLYFWSSIPVERLELSDFHCDNIADVVRINSRGNWGPDGRTKSCMIQNGLVENVECSTSRGNARTFYIEGDYTIRGVVFQNGLVKGIGATWAEPAPGSAGLGYAEGDIVTIDGGTPDTPAEFAVASVGGSGEIVTLTLQTAGSYNGILPSGDVATTTDGSGTGASLRINWDLPDYHHSVYSNHRRGTIEDCTFDNTSVSDEQATIDFKIGNDEGAKIVRNCVFRETHGWRTGCIRFQQADVSLQNCTWDGYDSTTYSTNFTDTLIQSTAGAIHTSHFEMSDCLMTNVTASSCVALLDGDENGRYLIEGNTAYVDSGSRFVYVSGSSTGGILEVRNNQVYGSEPDDLVYIGGTAVLRQAFITGNYSEVSRLLYNAAQTGTYYIDGNTCDASLACYWSHSPDGVVFGVNRFANRQEGVVTTITGEDINDLSAQATLGERVMFLGSLSSAPATLLPGSMFYNTTSKAIGTWAGGAMCYLQPLRDVAASALSGGVWITPGTDTSVQVVTSADGTAAIYLSATNAVAGTTFTIVNNDGSNTIAVDGDGDETGGNTTTKTIGTSSSGTFIWDQSAGVYRLISYGGI